MIISLATHRDSEPSVSGDENLWNGYGCGKQGKVRRKKIEEKRGNDHIPKR